MFELKIITDQKTWEKWLQSSSQASFLQSWQWGKKHELLGQRVWRYGLYENHHLVGLIQLIKVKAKRGTYLECPGGPVIGWNFETLKWLFSQLKRLAKEKEVSFIRFRPNILATPENLALVHRAAARRAPMHLHAETTWVLPLDKDENTLLGGMRKTTRYLIRKAEKLGVTISLSTVPADIDRLFELQQETVGRKHFVPFTKENFSAELQAFLPDNIRLFKAGYQGHLLAVAMIVFYGEEAVYHYSGSSNDYREIPASYLLQWEVIKTAKKLGCKRYNFWGYTTNPRHRFYGPSLFKAGFGGQEVDYLPAHDLVVGAAYWPNFVLETLRRKLRHL